MRRLAARLYLALCGLPLVTGALLTAISVVFVSKTLAAGAACLKSRDAHAMEELELDRYAGRSLFAADYVVVDHDAVGGQLRFEREAQTALAQVAAA